MKICVIGGGIVGLTTAFYLKRRNPSDEVTVFTLDTTPNTTGDGAAGLVWPYQSGSNSPTKLSRWTKATQDMAEHFWKSGKASRTGIFPCSMRIYNDYDTQHLTRNLLEGFRWLTKDEIETNFQYAINPPKIHVGYEAVAFIIQPTEFMQFLLGEFKELGGQVVIGHAVKSLNKFCFDGPGADYDVVINSTGLAAQDITRDEKLHPIRGQILCAPNDWITTATFNQERVDYIIPNQSKVVLGGTAENGQSDLEAQLKVRTKIIQGDSSLIPPIKFCSSVVSQGKDWVGLRPGRDRVRLEREIITNDGKQFQVIHNYGHGGSGITLCWGCAYDVCEKIEEIRRDEMVTWMSKI